MLRPGLRVFRRDDEHLQLGLDGERVVLPATPGVRRLLDDLGSGTEPGSLSPEAGLVLRDLVERGLVVDRAALAAAVAATGSRDAAGATYAAHGAAAPDRIAVRRESRVAVAAAEPWTRTATEWLAGAGIRVAGRTGPQPAPTATLVVSRGEPPRSDLDRWVREERPHLLVTLAPDRVRVGPFVSPGLTACLRCIDAHLAETDPRRGLVLEQLEGASATDPFDPVLAHLGLALAVRDLTSYVDGDRPATWSTTIEVGADLVMPRRHWTRHPHCGCSWA